MHILVDAKAFLRASFESDQKKKKEKKRRKEKEEKEDEIWMEEEVDSQIS